jgi:RNA polymerase sigma-70 factor (ECF subfamily)
MTRYTNVLDPSTIQAALIGDEIAWEKVIQTFQPELIAIVSQWLRPSEVEDVLQETWIRVWEHRSTFNRSPEHFGAWVGSIAYHRAVDLLRSAPRRKNLPLLTEHELVADLEPLPEEEALRHEEQQAVQELLDGLSSAQAEALRLFLWQGLSYEEIACRSGVESEVVKGRLRAARDSLRRHFNQGKVPELLVPASDHGGA